MTFTERWKAGENSVGVWLADTATGSIVKCGLAPLILWVGTEAANWSLPPWLLVVIVGGVPAATNALNRADARYGLLPEKPPEG